MKISPEDELPLQARTAFDSYPQLQVSASFNRAVLERLEQEGKRRRTTLLGRIEEFLGLDLWRFAASGMLGALLPAFFVGALLLCSSRSPSASEPSPEQPPVPPEVQSLGPFYARELELQRELLAAQPRRALPSASSGDEISCLDSKSHLG